MTGAAAATAPPRAKSRGRRIATALGIGCGGLLLVVLVVAAAVVWHFWSPGQQVATRRIVTDQTAGFLHVGDLAADPGTMAFLAELTQRFQRFQDARRAEQLPPPMRWLQSFRRQGDPGPIFHLLLPREATVALNATPGSEPAWVGAVNPRGFTQLIARMLRGSSIDPPDDYQGAQLFYLRGATAGLYDGTLVVSNSVDVTRASLDRLRGAGDAAPAAADVGAEGWDAILQLQGPFAAMVLGSIGFDPQQAALVRRVEAGLDVVSADELRLRAALTPDDPNTVPMLGTAMAGCIDGLKARLGRAAPTLAVQQDTSGDALTTVVTATQLGPAMDALVAASARDTPPPTPAR